jgi:hypothetical protein
MVFLKTRPTVEQNNAEFTNASSFTSLLLCSTHFTLYCRILLFSPPHHQNFFKFVYSEIPGESAWRTLFRPPWCYLLLWQLRYSELDSLRSWTSDIQDLLTSCRKFLYFIFSLNLVSCTQKMHWRVHSSADTVPLLLTILQFSSELSNTEVLICPIYAPHELILLDNGIRLIYFRICYPVFPPCIYNCCLMYDTY